MKTSYKCKRCGKEFKQKSNLVAHLSRKHPCLPLLSNVTQEECLTEWPTNQLSFSCPTCNKQFTTVVGLSYHVAHKVCSIKTKAPSNNTVQNNTITIINTQQNTTNNTVTNNNLFNININFAEGKRNFGSERLDYLTPEFIRECLQDLTYGLGKMVKEVYFNPEYPENHTVRVHSTKQKLMKIVHDNVTSFVPNSEVGKCVSLKLSIVLRQYLEPLIELLTQLSERDYDADDRKTFQAELESAIYQLEWLRDHTMTKLNKDMKISKGHDYIKTCNLVTAHIIGMSKAEKTDGNSASQAGLDHQMLKADNEWPSNVYPVIESSQDDETHCETEISDEQFLKRQDHPKHGTAFGNIKSDLTKDNVTKLTKFYRDAILTM